MLTLMEVGRTRSKSFVYLFVYCFWISELKNREHEGCEKKRKLSEIKNIE